MLCKRRRVRTRDLQRMSGAARLIDNIVLGQGLSADETMRP